MEGPAYAVGIVVDPAFGARLHALAEQLPLWVADTPGNRAAAEACWRGVTGGPETLDVTTFKVDLTGTPAGWCCEILPVVLEHHGEYAHNPPVSVLEIVGAQPEPELRAVLAAAGFTAVTTTAEGFRACAV